MLNPVPCWPAKDGISCLRVRLLRNKLMTVAAGA
jgi:hypothetical protein